MGRKNMLALITMNHSRYHIVGFERQTSDYSNMWSSCGIVSSAFGESIANSTLMIRIVLTLSICGCGNYLVQSSLIAQGTHSVHNAVALALESTSFLCQFCSVEQYVK